MQYKKVRILIKNSNLSHMYFNKKTENLAYKEVGLDM